jgi:hypothetical protein
VNYKNLPEFANLFMKIKPQAINFILFNPFYSSTQQELEMSCRFSDAEPYIKRTIDKLDSEIKKITVRYIPFCFMSGYEKYVCNTLQTEYDTDEWLPRVQAKVEEVESLRHYLFSLLENPLWKLFPKSDEVKTFLNWVPVRLFMKNYYIKPERCSKCKFRKICEGLKKGYARVLGTEELIPVLGKLVKDPLHYRGKYGSYGK